jgi:leucyl-tRNA synthetase
MPKYDFSKIERKWQRIWRQKKIYEPNLKKAKKPFYNLMMFPYPSAEGLHVGNMYAFTGADIFGRYMRMKGYNVFEPIGLDGFGIHSENYALQIGVHPMKQAKISKKRFYKQLEMIGNGFAWDKRLETYDPEYYKWTQWIFVQMFKHGLAYRKKQAVNWCPSCKTVLADEQVLQKRQETRDKRQEVLVGACERCETPVVKKELEQWFFKITKYAEKLLKNLDKIDWSEKVKIAQRNWIGESEGALINFEIAGGVAPSYVLLHGFTGSPNANFFPWLKKELEKRGAKVFVPALPNTDNPSIPEQVEFVLKNAEFNENTVLLGHSLGSVVGLKVIEKLDHPIKRFVSAAGFLELKFKDHSRPFEKSFDWKFDFERIKKNVRTIMILRDSSDDVVPEIQADKIQQAIGGEIIDFKAEDNHICGEVEPVVLKNCIGLIKVFTTRPDTLFGATYMVLGSEHSLVENLKSQITNYKQVADYVKKTKNKSEAERIEEGKEKTGVELKGIKAINPANNEEIPVWVADYVLSDVGAGAIMAVPAHDQRDYEFAKKFNLPLIPVIKPNITTSQVVRVGNAYEGRGVLINSGKFNGMDSEKAKWGIVEFVGGEKKTQYRLRDWLISRQRYWGPPMPVIFCENCKKLAESYKSYKSKRSYRSYNQGELENPGWIAVPGKDLPVKLPYVKDFRPKSKGESPLSSVKEFYETKCPKCGGKARRETDVSDTFLDSAWYYLRYPSIRSARAGTIPWDSTITKKWLPAGMYIGGAEHAVLHLLYVRFLAMALKDMGYLHFEEPFPKFRAHGLLISEGAKMSKSKGNVVNPDEYIKKFGADALRMYLMFLAPFEQGGDFRDAGILGITRFLERVWKLFHSRINTNIGTNNTNNIRAISGQISEHSRIVHRTIKKVTEDIENFRYNTAISALMILLNEMEKHPQLPITNYQLLLKLLAPFAPHLAEEIWQQLISASISQNQRKSAFESIHREPWPKYDLKLIKEETFMLIIQINGKVRDQIEVNKIITQKEAEALVFERERVKMYLNGKKPKKIIFVPSRLVNIVM